MQNLRKIILDFPSQFLKGKDLARDIKIKGQFSRLVISGMGGSALAGNILADWLEEELPIIVNRTYQLPPRVNKKDLIFISSYSGDTEEPISVYQETQRKKLKMAVFCSGGKLEKLCQKNETPLINLPKGFLPRYTLGLEFSAMATILSNSGLIKPLSDSWTNFLEKSKADLEKQGKKLAKKLINKIPLIYASDKYKALAYNWKIKFNENSKIMAFYNLFPELNHNELAGYGNPSRDSGISLFHTIIFKSSDDYLRIKKRMNLTAKMIKEKNGEVTLIDLQGRNYLERVFSGILLGDWTSYFLALEYGVDPIEVEMIEEFKKRMSS